MDTPWTKKISSKLIPKITLEIDKSKIQQKSPSQELEKISWDKLSGINWRSSREYIIFLEEHQEMLQYLYKNMIIPYSKKYYVNTPTYQEFCEFASAFSD